MSRASGNCLLRNSLCVRGDRKRKAKGTSAARLALDRYAPTMCGYDELNNTQSKTAAAALARQAVIHSVERLKNSSPVAGRDSDAVVRHGKNHVAILCPRPQEDVLDLF